MRELWTIATSLVAAGRLPRISTLTPAPVALGYSEDRELAAIAFLSGGERGERSEMTCLIACNRDEQWTILTSGGVSFAKSLEHPPAKDITRLVHVQGTAPHRARLDEYDDVSALAGRVPETVKQVIVKSDDLTLSICEVGPSPYFAVVYRSAGIANTRLVAG